MSLHITEQELTAALERHWKRVLGVEDAGMADNFFELGGESLAAIDLVESVYTDTGREIDLERVFADGSLGAILADLLSSRD